MLYSMRSVRLFQSLLLSLSVLINILLHCVVYLFCWSSSPLKQSCALSCELEMLPQYIALATNKCHTLRTNMCTADVMVLFLYPYGDCFSKPWHACTYI